MKLSLEKWALIACLTLGALLRVYLAVAEFGMIHADEQFQTIEPAARLVYGFGSVTWEWEEGSRSWLVPLLYVPVLGALKIIGVIGGNTAIAACRLWMVLFSLLTLWRFYLLLRLRGISSLSRFLTLGFFSLLPAMIYWAPTTFSDQWATCFLWVALCQAAFYFQGEKKRDAALASFFFLLTILARIQLLPWAGSALLIFFLQAKSARREIFLASLVPFLAAGLMDWVSWGAPYWSYYWNLAMNLLHGAADSNGTRPWWAYPEMLAANLGRPFFTVAAGCYLYCLARPGHWKRVDLLIFAPGLLHLFAHSLIPHKETRFLLPLIPLLFYSFALTADRVLRAGKNLACTAPLLVLFSAAILSFCAEKTYRPRQHYNELDITAPARLAYEDGLLKKYPESCLLLVNERWLWSRGELGFGQKVRHVRTDLRHITPRQVNECTYAIVPASMKVSFIWLSSIQGSWEIMGVDRWGHYLFRNNRPPLPSGKKD